MDSTTRARPAHADVSPELAEVGRAVSERLLAEHRAHAAKQAAEAISEALNWREYGKRYNREPDHGAVPRAKPTSHAKLLRIRYPPSGDPDLWALYGPDGPPEGVTT